MSQFAQDTAVVKVAENRWRGELRQGWRIGAVPTGGYVLAGAGRVLREALGIANAPASDPPAYIGRCPKCGGTNWGPSGRRKVDGAEVCLVTSTPLPPGSALMLTTMVGNVF